MKNTAILSILLAIASSPAFSQGVDPHSPKLPPGVVVIKDRPAPEDIKIDRMSFPELKAQMVERAKFSKRFQDRLLICLEKGVDEAALSECQKDYAMSTQAIMSRYTDSATAARKVIIIEPKNPKAK